MVLLWRNCKHTFIECSRGYSSIIILCTLKLVKKVLYEEQGYVISVKVAQWNFCNKMKHWVFPQIYPKLRCDYLNCAKFFFCKWWFPLRTVRTFWATHMFLIFHQGIFMGLVIWCSSSHVKQTVLNGMLVFVIVCWKSPHAYHTAIPWFYWVCQCK